MSSGNRTKLTDNININNEIIRYAPFIRHSGFLYRLFSETFNIVTLHLNIISSASVKKPLRMERPATRPLCKLYDLM